MSARSKTPQRFVCPTCSRQIRGWAPYLRHRRLKHAARPLIEAPGGALAVQRAAFDPIMGAVDAYSYEVRRHLDRHATLRAVVALLKGLNP